MSTSDLTPATNTTVNKDPISVVNLETSLKSQSSENKKKSKANTTLQTVAQSGGDIVKKDNKSKKKEPGVVTSENANSTKKTLKTKVSNTTESNDKDIEVEIKGNTKPKSKAKSKSKSKKDILEVSELEKDTDLEGGGLTDKKNVRSFKVKLPDKTEYEGRFTGLTPYQAANKALSKYYRETKDPLSQIEFTICESTRKSKKTEYTYIGTRHKLDVPIVYKIQDGREIVKNYKNNLKKVKKTTETVTQSESTT